MDEVEFLHRLVSIPSVSGDEAGVAAFLVEQMDERGFDSFIDDAGNAVGVLGDGPRQIVLLGHMDTVPGGPRAEIRDDTLYGRGSVDAKGPLATFVLAAAEVGPVDGWQIVVVGATEEEAATSAGARFAATQYAPEFCIIGEPSSWDALTLGYKGRLLLEYKWRQPTAHTAGPERRAAEHAVNLWNMITAYTETFNVDKDGIFNQLQPSLRSINTWRDGDDDCVEATFGFRLPPGLAPEKLQRDLQALNPNGGDISFRGAEPAYVGSRRTPLARAFLGAIREAGGRPRFKVKTGTSDMNVVGPAWGCPIAAYGPGDSALDHTPNEHVEIDEYLKAIDILTRAVRNLVEQ